jgi:hypothetical protein
MNATQPIRLAAGATALLLSLLPAGAAAKQPESPFTETFVRLSQCIGDRDMRALVHIEISKTGWAEVSEIVGAEDERVRTCVRVAVEELHFPKDVRGKARHIVMPIQMTRTTAKVVARARAGR